MEVDLDLHCIVKTKVASASRDVQVKKGLFKKVTETRTISSTNSKEHIYYGNRRNSSKFSGPCVWITEDQGVGNNGPKKPETLHFELPEAIEEVLIYCHNFGTNRPFSDYDAVCTVKVGDNELELKLDSNESKRYAVIAKITRVGENLKLININEMKNKEPKLGDYANLN